jgi:GNAT superfamily N-acetyltransferase
MEVMRASEADVAAVAELMNAAYGGAGEVRGWTHVARFLVGDRTSEGALRAELAANPEALLFIVRDGSGGALLGSVWLEPRREGVWYLGSLSVDPRRQSAGVGRRIVDWAEDWIQQRGGHTVEIDVLNVREPLIAWYQRCGYRLTGASHPYPYEDNRYGVPQRPDLAFVVLEKALARPVR